MRKLQEEEEASMSSSNAIKKLANEVKLKKEDVENMDFRYLFENTVEYLFMPIHYITISAKLSN